MGEPRTKLAPHHDEQSPPIKRGSPTAFFLILSALLFLLISCHYASANPSPPQAVVGILDGAFFNPATGVHNATVNLTFTASPDDPNGTSPAGSIYYDYSYAGPNGQWFTPLGPDLSGSVPDRPGWFYQTIDISFTDSNSTVPYSFNLTYVPNPNSVPSCVVTIDLTDPTTHDQCGGPIISRPIGTHATYTGTPGGYAGNNLTTQWPLSLQDSNQTIGNLSYQNVLQEVFTDAEGTNSTVTTFWDPRDSDDYSGLRTFNVTFAYGSNVTLPGGATLYVSFSSLRTAARAIDNNTHQWSNVSCFLTFAPYGGGFQDQTCGNFTQAQLGAIYNLHLGNLSAAGPTFPAVDFAGVSASTGLDNAALGYILGALLIAGCAIAGYAMAKQTGAMIAPVFGLALAGLMNLWPLWLLVLIFLAITGTAVLLATREGGRE